MGSKANAMDILCVVYMYITAHKTVARELSYETEIALQLILFVILRPIVSRTLTG